MMSSLYLVTNLRDISPQFLTRYNLQRRRILNAEVTIHNDKAYACTDLRPDFILSERFQESPNSKCLGGVYSWQTCQNGYFLCEMEGFAVPSREPSVFHQCADDSAVPFNFKCIDRTCMSSGFRYDPRLTDRFYQDTGIVFSCYAGRRTVSGSSLQHFCQDDPKDIFAEEIDAKTMVYIPAFAPLESRFTVSRHRYSTSKSFSGQAYWPDSETIFEMCYDCSKHRNLDQP